MKTYNFLFLAIMAGDISSIGKALAPVNLGMQFKFKSANCVVTKLHQDTFEYEFVNKTLAKKGVIYSISYKYWQHNCVTRVRGLFLR